MYISQKTEGCAAVGNIDQVEKTRNNFPGLI